LQESSSRRLPRAWTPINRSRLSLHSRSNREEGPRGVRGNRIPSIKLSQQLDCRSTAAHCSLPATGQRWVLRTSRVAADQTEAARPKEAFQCAPAESDAPLKGSRFIERPCSPFRASRGVFSCGVRDLSDRGAGVRLNDLRYWQPSSTFRSTASAPRSRA